MLSSPFNKKLGRKYFNSFALDNTTEEIVEKVNAVPSFSPILRVLLVNLFLDLIIGNFIGILLASVTYSLFYYVCSDDIQMLSTKERLIIRYHLSHERKVFGQLLLLGTILHDGVIYPFFFSLVAENLLPILDFFLLPRGLSVVILSFYSFYQREGMIILKSTGVVFLLLANSWFLLNLGTKEETFMDIRHHSVVEGVFVSKKRYSPVRLLNITVILFSVLMLLSFQSYPQIIGWITLGSVLIILLFLRDREDLTVVLYGNYGQKVLGPILIEKKDLLKFSKIFASMFGFEPQGRYSRSFPLALVPVEVASIYTIGVSAVQARVSRISIVSGAAIYIFIVGNMLVAVSASKRLLVTQFLLLVIISIFWFMFLWSFITRIIEVTQGRSQNEFFLIGDYFLGLFEQGSLHVVKNRLIASVETGSGSYRDFLQIVRYSNLSGFYFAWKSAIVLLLSGLVAVILFQWIRFGAINEEGIVLLLTYYVRSLFRDLNNFLIEGRGVVLLGSAVIWMLIVATLPRILIYLRPQILFSLKTSGVLQVMMTNDYQLEEAYMEVTQKISSNVDLGVGRRQNRGGAYHCRIDLVPLHLEYRLVVWANHMVGELETHSPCTFLVKVSAATGEGKIVLKLVDEERIVWQKTLLLLRNKVYLEDIETDLGTIRCRGEIVRWLA